MNLDISKNKDLVNFLNDKKFKRIFLLCGKNSFKNSGAEKIFSRILKNKDFKCYFKKSLYPELQELKKITLDIKKYNPDLILAIGGGSVIDYAKIANVIDLKENLIELIKNYSYPYKKKFTKLAVIPTTAGSGAEVTSNAVIYIGNTKYSFESNLLIPDYFFLMPELLISSSQKIKASAGFDAIAQSLESLVSRKSNSKSVIFATKSLQISTKSFDNYLNNPTLHNAGKMSIASHLAGKAINISKTTAPHAVSYPFTSFFNIGHGHAVSLFFEKFFEYNYRNMKSSKTNFDLSKRYNLIFDLFNVRNIEQFTSKISNIKKKSKLIDDLNLLNIDVQKNSKKIINGINLLRLSNNPINLEKKDLVDIIIRKK